MQFRVLFAHNKDNNLIKISSYGILQFLCYFITIVAVLLADEVYFGVATAPHSRFIQRTKQCNLIKEMSKQSFPMIMREAKKWMC